MFVYLFALAVGLSIGFIMSMPLGPVGLIVFQRSMFKSRLLGLVTGAGASLADASLASIGVFSIKAIWVFIDQYGYVLRIVGGLIILIIGLVSIYSKNKPELNNKKDTAITIFEHFISGFGLTITNPLAAFTFFFVFARAQRVVGIHNVAGSFSLIFGVMMGSFIWWMLLTYGASILGHKIKPDHVGLINKFFGFCIALIGAAMVLGAFL